MYDIYINKEFENTYVMDSGIINLSTNYIVKSGHDKYA